MCSRWNASTPDGGYEVFSTAEKADAAFAILERMLSTADVRCGDSQGSRCYDRAILTARQILPKWHHAEKRVLDDRKVTAELHTDLGRIFTALRAAGVPTDTPNPTWKMPLADVYKHEPVGEFL